MGKAADKPIDNFDGELEISVKFKASGKPVAVVVETRALPFLLEKEQLPMAETRVIEAMRSITDPFRVKVVTYINKEIEKEFSDEEPEPASENVLPLDENTETETT